MGCLKRGKAAIFANVDALDLLSALRAILMIIIIYG